ncbi:uncharacterized protein MYCGRDRAFT_109706 [Zymoseptoria tritici IPO323]|uniref:Uncharacterized protein n=1 Tax=Zymoseptoria tritici (strain CBS 115943 / IPO323) TaxID=336722 RepID=F9XEB0_ZYMTI|nr:uncharacterized protein MYCGRDRAFT_109706 [Zymoseptoria tritici IPO323]EGP86966.1 hypothetical protein MYCGRDRAFT_109706 [Zymoseptoria tritici IPO323]
MSWGSRRASQVFRLDEVRSSRRWKVTAEKKRGRSSARREGEMCRIDQIEVVGGLEGVEGRMWTVEEDMAWEKIRRRSSAGRPVRVARVGGEEGVVEEDVGEESIVEEESIVGEESMVEEESIIEEEFIVEEGIVEEESIVEEGIAEAIAKESNAEESVMDESIAQESIEEESIAEESIVAESNVESITESIVQCVNAA